MEASSKDIYRPIEVILEKVGDTVAPIMKDTIRKQTSDGARGELERSIAWRTANNHSAVEKSEDLIEAPPVNCVDIGSANSHAFYVEEGSSPHLNPEGTEEFVAEITEWVHRQGGDDNDVYMAIRAIRERGTDAMPFVKPTYEKMPSIVTPICAKVVHEYWASQRQV